MIKSANPVGTLYLVGSPIGNLEDMTFRAVRILKEADFVYCEDTRRTGLLLKHFAIRRENGCESFHDNSPAGIITKVRSQLEAGRSVAYVTDGGLPVVSDPGFVLVRAATEAGAPVTCVPGPSAGVMLFAVSGLPSPKYLFHGFFPRTRGEVERTLEHVREYPVAHIFYEAPSRLAASLDVLARNLPDATVVVGRELTKLHEEITRGTALEVAGRFPMGTKVRGECVLAVMHAGSRARGRGRVSTHAASTPDDARRDGEGVTVELTPEQQAEITAFVKSGISSKDAAKALSKKFGVARRVIYEFIIRKLT